MAKISELQLVQPNEALDENGLIPVVVNTENGKKINKVIQTQKLADEIIEFTSGEDGKLTQVLGEYTTKNELNEQLTQINSAIELKANADHNHSGLYSEKTHTHSYSEILGVPERLNVTQEQMDGLFNKVEEIDVNAVKIQENTEKINLILENGVGDDTVGDVNNLNTNNKQTIVDAINELEEMVNPFNITSFSISPNTVEKGATVTKVTCTWNYTKNISSQILDGNTVNASLRTQELRVNLTSPKTFSLVATSTSNTVKTTSATLSFLNGVYYGASSSTDYASSLIGGLTKVLASGRQRNFTVTANTNQYIYYSIPTSMGTPTFFVGGFEGGFDKVATLNYTNSQGYTESYDIYKSTTHGLGTTTVTVQ